MKEKIDDVIDEIAGEMQEKFMYEIEVRQRLQRKTEPMYPHQLHSVGGGLQPMEQCPEFRKVLSTVLTEDEFKKLKNSALSQF